MRPVVVEAEVDIRRSPEDVFDYCSDHCHEPEWNPMMKRIDKLTADPVGARNRYVAEVVKGPPMVTECTRYERPGAWSLTGDSSVMKATGAWRVLPAAGGSRLVMRAELELHGLLKLAGPLLRRREQPMFERDLGIKRVWMHRGPGTGSVSHAAAEYGRQRGITVIEGGCPCMFDPTADPGHKAMRFVLTLTGNVPRRA